jgi:hypothetical protein
MFSVILYALASPTKLFACCKALHMTLNLELQ